jgi:DNA-directed RNA polymerase specialized sigma subunit
MTHADCRLRDARIIERRREGFTLEQIAEIYDLSVARISQIVTRYKIENRLNSRFNPWTAESAQP